MSLVLRKNGNPFLYLGDWKLAADVDTLRSMGVTHLLNCAREVPVYYTLAKKVLHLRMDDSPSFPIDTYFNDAIAFIEDAYHTTPNGVVYVHCAAGISRSATIVLAYMVYKGVKLNDAISMLKVARPIVHPNHGFLSRLAAYSSSRGGDSGGHTHAHR